MEGRQDRTQKAVDEIKSKLKTANKELEDCESERKRLQSLCADARTGMELASAARTQAAEELQSHTPVSYTHLTLPTNREV